ncbi:MAG: cupin domain-containing protein [Bacteroidota bacterium]
MAAALIVDVTRMMDPKKATLETLKTMLERQGLSCEVVTDPPGTKYGMHKHEFDDFVVIVSGKMKLGTDTHTWTLEPGDRVDIPANSPHWAEVLGKKPVCYITSAG